MKAKSRSSHFFPFRLKNELTSNVITYLLGRSRFFTNKGSDNLFMQELKKEFSRNLLRIALLF